jgi:hypothetical protein
MGSRHFYVADPEEPPVKGQRAICGSRCPRDMTTSDAGKRDRLGRPIWRTICKNCRRVIKANGWQHLIVRRNKGGWTGADCANYCTPSFPHPSCPGPCAMKDTGAT